MSNDSTLHKNSKTSRIFFILSLSALTFWCLGQIINVYRFALVGAIFELLSLPMLCILFGIPILSLIFWAKEKFTMRSFYLYSALIGISTILLMVIRK